MSQRNYRSGASSSGRAIAPVHRGPQALMSPPLSTRADNAMMPKNAALLIDFDNVTMGIRSDLHAELKTLLSSDIIKGKPAVQRAYADWRRYPQYVVPLAESSIDMIMAPAYGSSKKNATDIRLAIDALELVFTRPDVTTFILLSGDSDFSSLVVKLKEYGKYVIGIGIRESSSDLLVMNCDEYYSYNALAGLVKNNEEESTRRDPWELVSESVARMKRNGDVMRSDRLKQVMQEIDSSFDEKDLGMPKFSRFVQEAAHRGLLKVTKLESGQLEVDAPTPGEGSVAAPVDGATAAVETEGRRDTAERTDRDRAERDRDDRRGRRGRRGRGRDRFERTEGERTETERAEVPAETLPTTVTPDAIFTPLNEPASDSTRAIAPTSFGVSVADNIGTSGERLTRSEAFDLVRRAAESLVSGDESTSASATRLRAFELLGRNSESLSARNFERILQDAHDANMIDLRRRGNDFEVARAAEAASIVEQLKVVDDAQKAEVKAQNALLPQAPRGMGARGIGGRGKGPVGPPPALLMVGVVGAAPSSSNGASAAAPSASVTSAPASTPSAAATPAAGAEESGAESTPATTAKGAKGAKAAAKGAAKAPAKAAAKSPAKKAAKAPAKAAAKAPAKKAAKAPAKKAAAKK